MDKKITLKVIKYIISLTIAFSILYFLFQHQDPARLIEEIKKVEGKWIILSMIFGGWAYIIRGLRWVILINALGYSSSKLTSIAAVSIGYFTNMFIPRAGEISRCTALSQVEKIPVDKLFGTILIERVLDFIFLIGLMLVTIIFKFNAISNFYVTLKAQEYVNTGNKKIFTLLIILTLGFICYYILKNKFKDSKFYYIFSSFLKGLKEGFKSIKNIKYKTAFWVHTFSIWIMYFLMTYICFFSMIETSHLTIEDGLFILLLGGIGMVIPTPGGIGSYHAIVMIGLSVLGVGTVNLGEGSDPTNPALIFPTIIHVAQTLVAIILGGLSLFILFLSKRKRNVTP